MTELPTRPKLSRTPTQKSPLEEFMADKRKELAGDMFALIRLAFITRHTLQHLCLLSHLYDEEIPTMDALSKMIGYKPSAATGNIDRLEKDGLVERFRKDPPTDRRRIYVRITKKGRDFLDRVLTDRFKEKTPQEARELLKSLSSPTQHPKQGAA